jgi:hypothetical protein
MVHSEYADLICNTSETGALIMFCQFCGEKNPEEAKFCAQCGQDLQSTAPDTVQDSTSPTVPPVNTDKTTSTNVITDRSPNILQFDDSTIIAKRGLRGNKIKARLWLPLIAIIILALVFITMPSGLNKMLFDYNLSRLAKDNDTKGIITLVDKNLNKGDYVVLGLEKLAQMNNPVGLQYLETNLLATNNSIKIKTQIAKILVDNQYRIMDTNSLYQLYKSTNDLNNSGYLETLLKNSDHATVSDLIIGDITTAVQNNSDFSVYYNYANLLVPEFSNEIKEAGMTPAPVKTIQDFYTAYFNGDYKTEAQKLSVFWAAKLLPDYANMSSVDLLNSRSKIEDEIAPVLANSDKKTPPPAGMSIEIVKGYTKIGQKSAIVVYQFKENGQVTGMESAVLILENGQFRIFNMSVADSSELDQIKSLDMDVLDQNFGNLMTSETNTSK